MIDPRQPGGGGNNVGNATLLREAAQCTMRGDIGRAEALAREVLARDPRHAGAMVELGRIAHRTGNKRAAADWLRQASASEPNNVQLANELAFLLIEVGDRQQALGAVMRALEIEPDDADAITNKGTFQLREGRLNEALAAYRRVIEIDPLHHNARFNIAVALRDAVSPWHFPMMNDAKRNAAYDAAIRRLARGRSVLDIGTGSGLLAMMAARAGARWVVSCELVPWIAAKAADVVAANGLADRIKLIAKRSADLQIGPDLPERAEVLVSEVFGSAVLNECVIPTIEDAHARLLKPGAAVIPSAARARVYLAGGAALESHLFVDRAAGFTLAPFNDFAQPRTGLDIHHVPHDVLSEDVEVFRFDFTRQLPHADQSVIEVAARRPGRCVGVVQWVRLDLVDGVVYENRPLSDTTSDGWGQMLYRFSEPIDLAAGDRVRLLAQHNGHSLLISNLPAAG
jgi:type II protein arginine methyltransferase